MTVKPRYVLAVCLVISLAASSCVSGLPKFGGFAGDHQSATQTLMLRNAHEESLIVEPQPNGGNEITITPGGVAELYFVVDSMIEDESTGSLGVDVLSEPIGVDYFRSGLALDQEISLRTSSGETFRVLVSVDCGPEGWRDGPAESETFEVTLMGPDDLSDVHRLCPQS